jgi:hypothetical protein
MKTTFRQGDCIVFEPLAGTRRPAPGDVVLFRSRPDPGIDTVHRVVSVNGENLVLRGDDNPSGETETVPLRDVLGRVTAVERNGRRFPVAGGAAGSLWAGFVSREGIPRRFLGALYGLLRRSRLLRLLWRPGLEAVRTEADPPGVYRLLSSGRVIGRWCPGRGILLLRKPWDLVVTAADCPDQP